MTEKEKRDNGELYLAELDEELVKEREKAKELCRMYNQKKYNEDKEKEEILKVLFKSKGKNTKIEPNFYCDYGYNIILGDNFYANHNLVILDCAEVKIGNNVYFGPNCGIYTAGHPLDFKQRNEGLEYAKPIKIGNNVWIGGNVVILPGVTIGDNSVIGAGSIVTKDIQENTVAVGNPCKEIKKLT